MYLPSEVNPKAIGLPDERLTASATGLNSTS